MEEETINHIFINCQKSNGLLIDLKLFFDNNIHFPELDPQSAIFGFSQVDHDCFLILNHILLLFKHYVYISRDSHKLSLAALIRNIKKVFALNVGFFSSSERLNFVL